MDLNLWIRQIKFFKFSAETQPFFTSFVGRANYAPDLKKSTKHAN
jgi:hypothetical protein